jgi:hypothetical protein
MDTTKICKSCNIEKNIEDFYLIKKNETKTYSICKICKNNIRVKLYHEKHIKKPKGLDKLVETKIITSEQKDEIITRSNG